MDKFRIQDSTLFSLRFLGRLYELKTTDNKIYRRRLLNLFQLSNMFSFSKWVSE
jgi:hypothetical protein